MRQKEIFPEDFLTGVSRSQSGISIVSGFILFAKTKNHEKAISREIGNPLPISAVENHLPSRRLFGNFFQLQLLFRGFPILHLFLFFGKLFSWSSFFLQRRRNSKHDQRFFFKTLIQFFNDFLITFWHSFSRLRMHCFFHSCLFCQLAQKFFQSG